MPTHGRELPVALRAAIVTCRLLYNEKFEVIATKLDVKVKTAQKIVKRAVQRANSEDFKEVLACLEDLNRSGRPPTVAEGSELSHQIRHSIRTHPDLPMHSAGNLVIPPGQKLLPRSIIERVAHTHRDDPEDDREIVRAISPVKPPNTEEDQELRVEFCEWALDKLSHGAIFIFSDESWVECGGKPRKKPRISRPKGVSSFEYPVNNPPVQFSLMIWGACCIKFNNPAPLFLWYKETEAEKELHQAQLDQENLVLETEVLRHRENAEIEGTEENRQLREINANIMRHNQALRSAGHRGNKGTKRIRKPEQIWKFEQLKREHKRGGIDWFLYRQKVLLPILYPYYEAVQRANPGVEVWLVEDNASPHAKAAAVCERDRRERGILKAPWPPNSPDLNVIEEAWAYLKDMIEGYTIEGSSEMAQNQLRACIVKEWEAEGMKQFLDDRCASFKEKLEICLTHNGRNNFKG